MILTLQTSKPARVAKSSRFLGFDRDCSDNLWDDPATCANTMYLGVMIQAWRQTHRLVLSSSFFSGQNNFLERRRMFYRVKLTSQIWIIFWAQVLHTGNRHWSKHSRFWLWRARFRPWETPKLKTNLEAVSLETTNTSFLGSYNQLLNTLCFRQTFSCFKTFVFLSANYRFEFLFVCAHSP